MKLDVKITKLVKEILAEDLPSRDDDNLLMLNVWKAQGLHKETRFSAFGKKFLNKTLAMPKTIERTRQLLQEKYIELRGELYEARHKQEMLEDKIS